MRDSRIFLLVGLLIFSEVLLAKITPGASSWEAMPNWLGNPAKNYGIGILEDGTIDFFVREAGKGMKWKKDLYLNISSYRWLIIEYRCLNYNPSASDYILWLNDGYPDGIRFPPDDFFKTDGQWHRIILDLYDYCRGQYIYQIALQTQAKEAEAHLLIRKFVFSEKPPEEGMMKLEETKTISIDIRPELWKAQESWLGNPATQHRVSLREGTVFSVGQPGKGMKWSLNLAEPLKEFAWISVRYRAKNLNPMNDYFLYIANAPGGKAPEEEYAILLSSLIDDGEWHTHIARIKKVKEINTIALQLQAGSKPAEIEVARISFSSTKPILPLEEILTYKRIKSMSPTLFPLPLPKGEGNIEELHERLSFTGWFQGDLIEINGVSFYLPKGNYPILRQRGKIRIPLHLKKDCKELYLLLFADLPKWEEPSFGGGEMSKIKQVERLRARLIYEDGDWDEQFPLRFANRKYEVVRGIDVYAIAMRKKAKEVQIINGMDNATFCLIALSASSKPGLASLALIPKSPPTPRTKSSLPPTPTSLEIKDDALSVDIREGSILIDIDQGIRLKSLKNRWLFKDMKVEESPLFLVSIGEEKISSEDFRIIEKVKFTDHILVRAVYKKGKLALESTLKVWRNKEGEIGLSISFKNIGEEKLKIASIFPIIRGIDLGSSPEDTYYFYPCRGGAITNKDFEFRTYYSGAFPVQIMGLFSYLNGGGVYLRTEDLSATPRWYILSKKGNVGAMEIEYLISDVQPNESLSLPNTIIGFSKGDWRSQMEAYLEWKNSWYKPYVPRKQWFREVFNFRQQFLFYEMPTKSPIFDTKEKKFHIEEALKQDEALFGGVDYLHIFDWAATPQYGRVGDYDHWEELGGLENFRRAIEETQEKRIPVGLYIEGYLVDPPSNLGKAKGKEWQILDKEGKPVPFFAPSYNMCPCLPAWREYLAQTYARVKSETGAKGYYIDEFGFALEARHCWNRAHNHPIPCSPVRGEFLTVQAVRRALGDEVVLYTEESPIDVTSQYQDGSFTYAISSISDELSPSHLNLYRFIFPDFKTFEIIVCDQPLGSNVQAVKRILFNGEGIWLEGMKEWFSEEVLNYIRKYHKVMKENKDCFTSLSPRPLVPTLVEGVYANMFPSEDGKSIVWTVYNTNPFTIDKEVIVLDYSQEANFRDVWNNIPIKPRVKEGKAFLHLKIPPQDVVVIRMEKLI
ncbi:hypothetical protein H5T87_05605 [bacterium]|nr:hypothetical protein [bacterium]